MEQSTAAVNTPERIRALIERDIADGVLPPGMPLDEKALAARFDVSRTPVREALLMLAARKLVAIVPRAGTFVYKPGPAELIALLEYLGELEGVSARLAALRMSAAQRDELGALHEKAMALAGDDDRPGYEACNLALHQLIYAGSGNAIVRDEINDARLRLSNFRRNVFDQPGRLKVSCAEHEAIVRAIRAGDGEAAAQAMRDHIIGKGKAFADLVLANAQ
ncbi:GntR family transcriptional regulator [Bordetella bronchialis]|nr:GntR family transcriptional regulator [Bordetella bronchialis]